MILIDLRMKRGADLLETRKFMISHVARLSGYESAPAFAAAFRRTYNLTPHEYRRAKKGPARAGGATGAFAKSNSTTRPGLAGGWEAIDSQMMTEAQARIEDRNLLEHFHPGRGSSIEAIAQEIEDPQRLCDKPAYWRERRRALDEWIDEHDRPVAGRRTEVERLLAEHPDDPSSSSGDETR